MTALDAGPVGPGGVMFAEASADTPLAPLSAVLVAIDPELAPALLLLLLLPLCPLFTLPPLPWPPLLAPPPPLPLLLPAAPPPPPPPLPLPDVSNTGPRSSGGSVAKPTEGGAYWNTE